MFREDEKEERGVLLFLALLIGLIVAGIFGFAVYQSGALKPLVGDAHVIGKLDGSAEEADADADGALAASAAGATAALVSQIEESGLGDAVTAAGSYVQQAVGGQTDADQAEGHHLHGSDDGTLADTAHMTEAGSDSTHSEQGGTAVPDAGDVTEQQLREAQLEDPHAAQTETETDADAVAPQADDSTLSDESGAAFSLIDGVARFYFATGKTKVIDGAVEQLGGIVSELKKGEKKAVLSGFVDPRGSVEQNAELAKNRAQAVRNLLMAQGVAEEAIELRKPSDIVPEGEDYAELRRVELRLEER